MAKKKITPDNIRIKADEALDELMGKTKINELNIDMFKGKSRQELEKEYEQKKKEWIAKQFDYSYNKDKSRDAIESDWDQKYPEGIDEWIRSYTHLNALGEQKIIDKINEIIKELNRR